MFEAVTATMKQLKGSYSIISLISQARSDVTKLSIPHTDPTHQLRAARWACSRSATRSAFAR